MINIHKEHGTYEYKGVTRTDNGIQFVWKGAPSFLRAEIVFFAREKEICRISVEDEYRQGSLYSVVLSGIPKEADGYQYYQNGVMLTDSYAYSVQGFDKYREEKSKTPVYGLPGREFDWENDIPLRIPMNETIIYGIHARGFTKSSTSGLGSKVRGTYQGIIEKIPYLNDLGITALELQPVHEFDEMYREEKKVTAANIKPQEEKTNNLPNYWGYVDGYYYAPKSAYSSTKDAVYEFKSMVKALHSAGIEIILQIPVVKRMSVLEITDLLHHWVREYHVDGFRLIGGNLPLESIATDPYLSDTKLVCTWFPVDDIYGEIVDTYKSDAIWKKCFKNIGIVNKDFLINMRKVLKGESISLECLLANLRDNGYRYASIHGIDDYDGFNLADLVSYDNKHNEDNNEDNRDGSPYEYSWNCGMEGKSRRKNITDLRFRQMKNALALVMTAQGTPFIKAGDEMGHTQCGNNNPYCQDNAVSWVNWKLTKDSEKLLEYTKNLISIRKNSGVMSRPLPLAMMDTLGCGYPDVSYHGEKPWKSDLSAYQSYVGILFYKDYSVNDSKKSYFIAYNLNWNTHVFGLPKIKNTIAWQKVSYSGDEELEIKDSVTLPGRSILILEATSKS